MIGLYIPGDTVLHRARAGLKLAALASLVVVIVVVPTWWMLAASAMLGALLFALARVSARVALAQLKPVVWILAIAAPVNALFNGWESALVMALRVSICVALAALVTLTTRTTEMLDAIRALLRPFGDRIDAERVGIVLAMTIRAVPLMSEIVRAVLEARRARGVDNSLRALAVPVVVRSLQTADAMGEALVARGFDD